MLRAVTASFVITLMTGAAQAAPDSTAATGAKAPSKPRAGGRAAAKRAGPAQVAVLETAQGKVVLTFFDKDAPKTAANFRRLLQEKFYDGTYFHRLIAGFMIQGGDPNTKNSDPSDDGMGGPGYTVPAEIKLPHLRGSVATARQGDDVNPTKASNGSQFFIDLAPQPALDRGGYTVFGEVISGMDVVDKIAALIPEGKSFGNAGYNPGKAALITRAYLEPLSKWEKPAAAATGGK
jgi:cyclophilin family peptidyl-prolyl cis-trans isomerase